MMHGRFPRFQKGGRNLDNLRVIPTEYNVKPVEPIITVKKKQKKNYYGGSGKPRRAARSRKFKKQRKREATRYATLQAIKENSDYHWYNPNYFKKNVISDNKNLENVSKDSHNINLTDVPVEESYFEEVEVASYDCESQQEIPVGFRKSKIQYLKYKKNCFFKPKIFKIGAQRTIVNCLNLQDSHPNTDVDIISEAEYEDEKPDEDDLEEKAEIVDEKEEDDSITILSSDEDDLTKKQEIIRLEDENDSNDSIRILSVTSNKNVNKTKELEMRIYKASIGNTDLGLHQGKSLIQSSLDSWKSHLIGLEYMIEIRNESGDSVLNYRCVLCNEDLVIKESPALCVIDHINKYKHMVKYLEKHFPACGYRFTENSDCDDIIVLLRICEEISNNLGFYYMCMVDLDHYKKNKDKINDIIKKSSHMSEEDVNFDKSMFQKVRETVLREEINNVLNDIITTVTGEASAENLFEASAHTFSSIPVVSESKKLCKAKTNKQVRVTKNSVMSNISRSDQLMQKKEKGLSESKSKYNCHSSMSSYLKLKYCIPKPKRKLNQDLQNKSEGETYEIDIVPKRTVIERPKTVVSKVCDPEALKSSKVVPSVDESEVEILEADQKSKTKVMQKSTFQSEIVPEDHQINKEKVTQKSADEDEIEIIEIDQKSKEKVLQKSTVHSKHCRKRILGKESSRVTANTSIKELATNIAAKSNLKSSSVNKSKRLISASKKIISLKSKSGTSKVGSKYSIIKAIGKSHEVKSPLRKVVRIPKSNSMGSSVPVKGHSKSSGLKIVHGKESDFSKRQIHVLVRNARAQTQPEKNYSNPVVLHPRDSPQHVLRSPDRIHSRSPIRKSPSQRTLVRLSRSPVKKITSPIRLIKSSVRHNSRSPARKHMVSKDSIEFHSRSPVRKKSRSPTRRKSRSPIKRRSRSPRGRHFKSPLRIHSRSPLRRHSRSPLRRYSRSPLRRYSRSPVRRHSRSPIRRHSRSPAARRHSRSPARRHSRHSRSPIRRHSRSPRRRLSRSPARRLSRSPARRLSRSPARRLSRSPVRRLSRSPVRRLSRSPVRRHPRSPMRRHSRSPIRKHSRSPKRRHSRSPIRRHSRSPIRRHSRSPLKSSKSPIHLRSKSPIKNYKSSYKVYSPSSKHPGGIHDDKHIQKMFPGPSRSSVHDYEKHLSTRDSEYSKTRTVSKKLSPSRNAPEKFIHSRSFPSAQEQIMNDLDPVSDEDESVYFNTADKHQHVDDIKLSDSTKAVLAQLFQKFSMAETTRSDPTLRKLVQFMEAHNSEMNELMRARSDMNPSKSDMSIKERNMFLQRYLLSNLAENVQAPVSQAMPFSPSLPPNFTQSPFLEDRTQPIYGLPPNVAPPHPSQLVSNVATPHPSQLVHNRQQQFFPPNLSVPPPIQHSHLNCPPQELPPKPKVAPEVMFKDLKATVNKLFGANESAAKQEKNKSSVPAYVTEPDPHKWNLNHPTAPKFSGPIGPKNILSQGKNINFCGLTESSSRGDMSRPYNNNAGQFFNNSDRPQPLNMPIPPPDAKVAFCDVSRGSAKGNLFPVVQSPPSQNFAPSSSRGAVSDVKLSLAQRLASVLVKVGMIDVPAPLLQEMLMKIGAFSSSPPQDITEAEIISILKRLGYLS